MIEYVAETGSTNADLIERYKNGYAVHENAWLVADRQSAGRGRQGREWTDGGGNFMGSTIVLPSSGDPAIRTLSLVTGIAVHETCVSFAPNARFTLKWPNDLMVEGAKIAGVLLEGFDDAVVVGVGVNLAKSPSIAERSTTAFAEFADIPMRNVFAERLCAEFGKALDRWRTYGLDPILLRWLQLAHPIDTRLKVHGENGAFVSGRFEGLGPDGALLLRTADGAHRAIHSG
ncbi:MAG: biotin--[acetyl-CoA-carboxylase] ligase, partial [Pontixanthobacter sp.]